VLTKSLTTAAAAGVWFLRNSPDQQFFDLLPEGEGSWVLRIYYENHDQLVELTTWLAPWEVHPEQGYL
jgi:hypothetical protein